jgi:hypothetical protein
MIGKSSLRGTFFHLQLPERRKVRIFRYNKEIKVMKIENGNYMVKQEVLTYLEKLESAGYSTSILRWRITNLPEYSEDGLCKAEHVKVTLEKTEVTLEKANDKISFREMECYVTTHVVI